MFKCLARIFCLIAVMVFSKNPRSFSQNVLILDSFSAFKTEEMVHLDWVIKSGITCNGISIQRAVDSINFSIIGHITGTCGNLSSPQPYNFIDVSPIKNSLNFYRLDLGGLGYSKAISIGIIDYGNNEFQMRPNPINSEAKLYFKNPNKEVVNFRFYDLNGKGLYSLATKEDYIELNAKDVANGLYPFTISTKAEIVITKGKILVQH